MEVKDIKNPKFIKTMSNEELDKLSTDIRAFIVESVSKTGGHLSSNLGIVDLTIALHKVFDFSKDKIVFDVSHQCYTHKILTGRAENFKTLRQMDGLSGFQKRKESIYDHYEAGHSSTSISAAMGLAIARDQKGSDYDIVALIGDGSIANGLAFEALNHLATLNTKLIIILNDNEMSISSSIGGIHNNLDRIRVNHGYNETKDKTKKLLERIPYIGLPLTNGIKRLKSSLKKLYLKDGYLFEELGIKYYGPINGHDYKEMITYLNLAKKETSPVIIHVITEKGKGYFPCEHDSIGRWHGVGPFDIRTGEFKKKETDDISWSEVISNHLIELTSKNKKINVITPAMAGGSKLLKYRVIYPDNFIDVGMAEEHALVLANGMSIDGLIPFVSIYSTFLQRGYDEVLHDIARMNGHVILGIDRCGIVGEDGETHQGIYDLTFLLPIPNIVIATPKDAIEAGNLLYTAVKNNKPFAIRYSKGLIHYEKQKAYEEIDIGSWEYISKGTNAVIISYGDFLNNAIKIRDNLRDIQNIGVVNARFQKPIDENMFEDILKQYRYIFIYEEQTMINSLGAYLVNYANNCGYTGHIKIFAIDDHFIEQGKKEEVIKTLGLDVRTVGREIKRTIKKI